MKNIYPHKYSRKSISDAVNTILNVLAVKGRITEMEKYIQHGQITCLEHCRAVAYFSLLLAHSLNLTCNYKSLVKAALLHDYFLYDWHEKSTEHRLHGFHHPKKFGWIYETALCSVREHKYINRGFLNGPYCPIYGCGAVLVVILLSRIENTIILFFASVVMTCSLEYFTGWMLEKMFHAKWWNYSDNRFNIHGRICLLGAVAFGSFSVILLKIVHPVVIQVTNTIVQHDIIMLAVLIVSIIGIDIVYTFICLKKFNSKIKKVYQTIGNLVLLPNNTSINILLNEHYSQYKEKMSQLIKYFNGQELRMIKAFPKMKSTLYNGTIHKIYIWLNQQHK